MYRSILVPLDGSPLAEEALPWARFLAAGLGIPLRVLRVVASESPDDTELIAGGYLRETVHQLDVEAEVLTRIGRSADEILRAAAEAPDPLIVLTTHGRTGFERWLVGSVAERVVRGAHAPVFVLRSGSPSMAQPSLARIMVPLDGSSLAEAALPHAEALARAFGAELWLARVAETAQLDEIADSSALTSLRQTVPPLKQGLVEVGERYLAATQERVAANGGSARWVVLRGEVVPALLRELESSRIDLVVLATHGRGGLEHRLLGSVAERLLQRSPLPILMVHPGGHKPGTA